MITIHREMRLICLNLRLLSGPVSAIPVSVRGSYSEPPKAACMVETSRQDNKCFHYEFHITGIPIEEYSKSISDSKHSFVSHGIQV